MKECERGYAGSAFCRATPYTFIKNDYIELKEFSSSNTKLGKDLYEAQWNITYLPKKDFQQLPGWIALKNNFDVDITRSRKYPSCLAIRIYHMGEHPSPRLVKMVIDIIFGEE